MMARKPKDESSPHDKIVAEAKERFARCEEYESDFRKLFVEDLRFANGDSDNSWQWPDPILNARGDRPHLTVNKVRQHNLQIVNDAKQNKPSVKTLPVDGEADIEIAKILDGMVRHIEYNSHAEIVYDTGTEFQVQGGLGYWRIVCEYAHDGSFDQEIFLRRVKDPLTIYLDCDIESADGADAKFGFVFEEMSKTEFEAKYPSEEARSVVFGDDTSTHGGWISKDRIRVCEYFRKTMKTTDMLVNHPERGPVRLSSIEDPEERAVIERDKTVQKREISEPEITWYLIAGDKVIDERPWAGRYIPIVRVVGEEMVINGKVERKGHTRSMKDAQRMYNYMTSANVEFIALQTKTPYVAPAEAIEGYEDEWQRANDDNLPYLPYNSLREDGSQIPRPQREQPPVGASAYLTGMQTAQQELMMASGQYQEQFGQPSNAQAGVAIQARQRQGDRATYHFIDNVARAIRYTGRVLIDLIPKIYDTARVVRIVGEDGTETFAKIDPNQQQPLTQVPHPTIADEVQLIFNPGIGRYDVTVEVGPNYETRRQEAFNALTQIMGQDQQLMKVAGDLLFKAADFPMADEVAERLHRTIPPQILGEGPSPQEQDMQQKMAQMGQMIEHLTTLLQQARQGREQQEVEIKAYDAETKRLQALGQPLDPQVVAHVATQVVMQMMQQGMPTGADTPPPDPAAAPQSQPNPPSAGFLTPAPQGQ